MHVGSSVSSLPPFDSSKLDEAVADLEKRVKKLEVNEKQI